MITESSDCDSLSEEAHVPDDYADLKFQVREKELLEKLNRLGLGQSLLDAVDWTALSASEQGRVICRRRLAQALASKMLDKRLTEDVAIYIVREYDKAVKDCCEELSPALD